MLLFVDYAEFLLSTETCQSFLSKSEESNTDFIAKEYVLLYSEYNLQSKTGIFFFFILNVSLFLLTTLSPRKHDYI